MCKSDLSSSNCPPVDSLLKIALHPDLDANEAKSALNVIYPP